MTVADVEMTGGDLNVHLKMNNIDLTTRMTSSTRVRLGDQVKISLNLDAISLFDPVQGTRL
jgi:ABC-type sugar transport system ATPase subunit